jgi:hypothetical protein
MLLAQEGTHQRLALASIVHERYPPIKRCPLRSRASETSALLGGSTGQDSNQRRFISLSRYIRKSSGSQATFFAVSQRRAGI